MSAPQDSAALEHEAEELFLEHVSGGPTSREELEALCAEHPRHAERLRHFHAAWSWAEDQSGAGGDSGDEPAPPPPPSSDPGRYSVAEKLGVGGMSTVHLLRDASLQRQLAMKVSRHRAESARGRVQLGRFVREARLMGRLDHPGVVPVHDLGVNADGRPFIMMRLVRGDHFQTIIERVHGGDREWSTTRALHVLATVCETLAYAHAKGVIHRDLKPTNVMIGRFGQVYVIDWGLAALVEGGADSSTDGGPLQDDAQAWTTSDGQVLGTPSYMPPEQADGRRQELGPTTDVYAVGAMLYHVLGGAMPYADESREGSKAVLDAVRARAPRPLELVAPQAAPELVAICKKAMHRDVERRYTSMQALGDDLRAYLEGRVVRALEQGAWPELRKWIGRNRTVTVLAVAVLALALAGLTGVLWTESRGRKELLRLSDARELRLMQERAAAIWPAHPDNAPAMEEWLRDAGELTGRLDDHRATLDALRASADAVGPGYDFEDSEDQWWHENLTVLVDDLEAFTHPSEGAVAGMQERLRFARTIAERSTTGPEPQRLWAEAQRLIADESVCPAYGGLELRPQIGLLPLGPDPESGLWEFVHLQSGTVPQRDPDSGRITPAADMGLVLVLVPGGRFLMGAQRTDPGGPGYDPEAFHNEGPPHHVDLAPFLISKYEMTQGQWLRATGQRPSNLAGGETHGGREHGDLNPVEQVDWIACDRTLRNLGLLLPTEAQWELAARGGTDTPWWTGAADRSVDGAANIADAWCAAHDGPTGWAIETWLDDGYTFHAPVGRYRANGFGLHDTAGNLWEWTRDPVGSYGDPVRPGDGLRLAPTGSEEPNRIHRGGSFSRPANQARSTARHDARPTLEYYNLGVRPARALDL
jgi:formylglycine-generating enzyme required for sulfatase activity/tRNA A-37 threonylcarbamoyl transferase component Bud32